VNCCARNKWRRAIGWIAAYALALQTIVGGIDLVQNAASAATLDPATIICHGHGVDDGAASQIPGNTDKGRVCGDCGCCLAAPPFLALPSLRNFVAVVLDAREIIWPTAIWQNEFAVRHPSQRPRGPPLPA
jgi:hypothetical protein